MSPHPGVHYRPYGPDTANYCYAGEGRPGEGDGTTLLWFVGCDHCLTQLNVDVLESRRQLIAHHMSQGQLQADLVRQIEAGPTAEDVDRLLARVEIILISNLQEPARQAARLVKERLKQALSPPAAVSPKGP